MKYIVGLIFLIASILRQGKGIYKKANRPLSSRIPTKWFLRGLKVAVHSFKFITAVGSADEKAEFDQNTVSNPVRKVLGRKSFCIQYLYTLTIKSRVIRKERSPLLLNHPKHQVALFASLLTKRILWYMRFPIAEIQELLLQKTLHMFHQ